MKSSTLIHIVHRNQSRPFQTQDPAPHPLTKAYVSSILNVSPFANPSHLLVFVKQLLIFIHPFTI